MPGERATAEPSDARDGRSVPVRPRAFLSDAVPVRQRTSPTRGYRRSSQDRPHRPHQHLQDWAGRGCRVSATRRPATGWVPPRAATAPNSGIDPIRHRDARPPGRVNPRRRRGLLLLCVALASGGLAASRRTTASSARRRGSVQRCRCSSPPATSERARESREQPSACGACPSASHRPTHCRRPTR